MTLHGWISRPLTVWLLLAGAAALVAASLGILDVMQPEATPALRNVPAAAAALIGLGALGMALRHALRLQGQQRRAQGETGRLEALVRER